MGRGAILGIVAALLAVGAAVAFGARTDARIHRLHVPPPPVAGGSGDISQPGTPDPSDPSAPPAAPSPPPPGSPPPPPGTPPPPPPPAFACAANTGETTGLSGTGLLTNFAIGGLPATVPSAPALRFRGVNQTPMTTHNLTLRTVGGAQALCGTGNLAGGAASTFTVTNLAPGTYQLYCTIHAPMVANITVT